MFNSIRMQKTLTMSCFLVGLFFWNFGGAAAMAEDIYGTYRLAEKEFVIIPGEKHTVTVPVWNKNKDIINPSFKLKTDKNNRRHARIEHDKNLQDNGKVLGIYKLVIKDSINRKLTYNDFIFLKNPEVSKPATRLVKSENRIFIVHVDRNQEHKNQQIQIANKLHLEYFSILF